MWCCVWKRRSDTTPRLSEPLKDSESSRLSMVTWCSQANNRTLCKQIFGVYREERRDTVIKCNKGNVPCPQALTRVWACLSFEPDGSAEPASRICHVLRTCVSGRSTSVALDTCMTAFLLESEGGKITACGRDNFKDI